MKGLTVPSPLSLADITMKIYLKRAMKVNVQKIKESTPYISSSSSWRLSFPEKVVL